MEKNEKNEKNELEDLKNLRNVDLCYIIRHNKELRKQACLAILNNIHSNEDLTFILKYEKSLNEIVSKKMIKGLTDEKDLKNLIKYSEDENIRNEAAIKLIEKYGKKKKNLRYVIMKIKNDSIKEMAGERLLSKNPTHEDLYFLIFSGLNSSSQKAWDKLMEKPNNKDFHMLIRTEHMFRQKAIEEYIKNKAVK